MHLRQKGEGIFRRSRFVCLLLAELALPAMNSEAQTPEGSRPRSPDVLVLILATGLPEDEVSITYATPVTMETCQRDVQQLATRGCWEIRGFTMNPSGPNDETTCGFRSPSVILRRSSLLPFNPFLETFQRFDYLRLVFVVGGNNAPATEWTDYRDPHVDVHLSCNGSTYTYDIRYKDHHFEHLSVAATGSGSLASRRKLAARKAELLVLTVLTLTVSAVGVCLMVVFAYISRRRRRNMEKISSRRIGHCWISKNFSVWR